MSGTKRAWAFSFNLSLSLPLPRPSALLPSSTCRVASSMSGSEQPIRLPFVNNKSTFLFHRAKLFHTPTTPVKVGLATAVPGPPSSGITKIIIIIIKVEGLLVIHL